MFLLINLLQESFLKKNENTRQNWNKKKIKERNKEYLINYRERKKENENVCNKQKSANKDSKQNRKEGKECRKRNAIN
jgi:hypothetical protein